MSVFLIRWVVFFKSSHREEYCIEYCNLKFFFVFRIGLRELYWRLQFEVFFFFLVVFRLGIGKFFFSLWGWQTELTLEECQKKKEHYVAALFIKVDEVDEFIWHIFVIRLVKWAGLVLRFDEVFDEVGNKRILVIFRKEFNNCVSS